MTNIILATLSILLTTYAQITLRMRLQTKPVEASLLNFDYWLYLMTDIGVWSCAISFGLSFACWSLVVASHANVAKLYPITAALSLVAITALNIFIFNDKFTAVNLVGGGLIILGIFLLFNQSAPDVVSIASATYSEQ